MFISLKRASLKWNHWKMSASQMCIEEKCMFFFSQKVSKILQVKKTGFFSINFFSKKWNLTIVTHLLRSWYQGQLFPKSLCVGLVDAAFADHLLSPPPSTWWGWKVTRPPRRAGGPGPLWGAAEAVAEGPLPSSGRPSRNPSPRTSWATSWPPTSLSSSKSAPQNLDLSGKLALTF